MTKLAQRMAVAALAVVGLFGGSANAQKVAVVDAVSVVSSMPEYVSANQKLEAQRTIWMDTIKTMQTQYQTKMETYSKVGETASAEFKKKAQEDLAGLEQSFTKFRDSKFGQEGELAQMQAQMMKPITEKVQAALQSYAKKEKISIILPKTATVFVDDAVDLTAKFTQYLKSQASK
jgi:Skp family chaperone for outer membrane proteins